MMILIDTSKQLKKLRKVIEKAQEFGFPQVYIYDDGYCEPEGEEYTYNLEVKENTTIKDLIAQLPLTGPDIAEIFDALSRRLQQAKNKRYAFIGICKDLKTVHAYLKVRCLGKTPLYIIDVNEGPESIECQIGQITNSVLLTPEPEERSGM